MAIKVYTSTSFTLASIEPGRTTFKNGLLGILGAARVSFAQGEHRNFRPRSKTGMVNANPPFADASPGQNATYFQ